MTIRGKQFAQAFILVDLVSVLTRFSDVNIHIRRKRKQLNRTISLGNELSSFCWKWEIGTARLLPHAGVLCRHPKK